MDLTWAAAGSVILVGAGYAFVRRTRRPRFVCWSLLCASLFALATRDLFRPRERNRPTGRTAERPTRPASEHPTGQASDRTRNRAGARRDRTGAPGRDRASSRSAGETPSPLVARLRRRFARWLD